MDFNEQIKKASEQAISDKVFPGCVVAIVNKSGERQVLPFGNFTYDTASPMVEKDTMYDTASLTKSIPTGCLALQLIDQKVLGLEDKLTDYLPEFNNSDRDNVLIKHLLTYTLDAYGFTSTASKVQNKSLENLSADDLTEILLNQNFNRHPGETFKYTNIPATLLGLVIEKVTGETLDNLADQRFFKPLNMGRSTFYPENFSLDEIPPTEVNEWRGLVHGVVHDESAYVFKKEGKVVGHAGLFSTAPDILNFLEMLLHGGSLNGRTYFSNEIMNQIQSNQIQHLGASTGLGWELFQPRYMGNFASDHTFGKTGFTGTLCVCDVKKGIAYVILSNRIYPNRPEDSSKINTFRKRVGEIILN